MAHEIDEKARPRDPGLLRLMQLLLWPLTMLFAAICSILSGAREGAGRWLRWLGLDAESHVSRTSSPATALAQQRARRRAAGAARAGHAGACDAGGAPEPARTRSALRHPMSKPLLDIADDGEAGSSSASSTAGGPLAAASGASGARGAGARGAAAPLPRSYGAWVGAEELEWFERRVAPVERRLLAAAGVGVGGAGSSGGAPSADIGDGWSLMMDKHVPGEVRWRWRWRWRRRSRCLFCCCCEAGWGLWGRISSALCHSFQLQQQHNNNAPYHPLFTQQLRYLAYMRPLPNGTTEYLSLTLSADTTAPEMAEFFADDAAVSGAATLEGWRERGGGVRE